MLAVRAATLLGVLALLAGSSSARAQGVLARGADGEVACVPGDAHTHLGAICDGLSCPAPRVCLEVPGLGARCLDPANEIACFPGSEGCDACPLISTGADPESCRVVDLPAGRHALCFYSGGLLCLGEATRDIGACLPEIGDTPSIAAGDCDGDGVVNAADRCLCESAPGSADGCAFDGGAPIDAGSLEPIDAAVPDAGGDELDASAALDAAQEAALPSFRGGGGCTCGVHRATRGGAPLAMVLFVLAVARRSSRRRSR